MIKIAKQRSDRFSVSKMSTLFERRTFEAYNDLDGVYSYRDLDFKKCKFLGCSIGYGYSPDYSRRTTAERISIKDCEARKCQIKAAVFREVLVQNIRSDTIMVYGALFEHVKFKGRCGIWLIHGTFMGVNSTEADEARYQDLCDK